MRFVLLLLASVTAVTLQAPLPLPDTLDKAAMTWVDTTFKKMTLEDKVGQLVVSSIRSTYLPTDTDAFDQLAQKVKQLRLGGFHVFGGAEAVPDVVLGNHYGAVTLGQPLEAASLLNRLQALSAIPLLNTADFEAGAGFRVSGATTFPRQMAVAASADEKLAFDAAKITAIESRAIGVHLNFSPVADVNNNARNPVINTRSFGESPDSASRDRKSTRLNSSHLG